LLAEEAMAQEIHVVLGPTINRHRSLLGGRLFEDVAVGQLDAFRRAAFGSPIRDDAEPPDELRSAITWLTANTVQMGAFKEHSSRGALTRALLARISQTKTGAKAAPSTAIRRPQSANA
jgi:hypothetical protein